MEKYLYSGVERRAGQPKVRPFNEKSKTFSSDKLPLSLRISADGNSFDLFNGVVSLQNICKSFFTNSSIHIHWQLNCYCM